MNKLYNNSKISEDIDVLYNEYLDEWVKYINSLNIKDLQSIILFIQESMQYGFFSLRQLEYHNFKFDPTYKQKYFGYRMASGLTVCRHNAKFFADLLNKLGCNAEYLGGRVCSLSDQTGAHAIVGVEKDDKALIIDPTFIDFLFPYDLEFDETTIKYKLANLLVSLIDKTNLKNGVLCYYNHEDAVFLIGNVKKYLELIQKLYDTGTMTKEELTEYAKTAHDYFKSEFDNLFHVRDSLIGKMYDLSNLERKLCPHFF